MFLPRELCLELESIKDELGVSRAETSVKLLESKPIMSHRDVCSP
jgi:hypothetical protein